MMIAFDRNASLSDRLGFGPLRDRSAALELRRDSRDCGFVGGFADEAPIQWAFELFE